MGTPGPRCVSSSLRLWSCRPLWRRGGLGGEGWCELCTTTLRNMQYQTAPWCVEGGLFSDLGPKVCTNLITTLQSPEFKSKISVLNSKGCLKKDVLTGEVEVVQPCPAHAICGEVPRSGMYAAPDTQTAAFGAYGRSYCPPDARIKLEPGPFDPAEPPSSHMFSHSYDQNPNTPFNHDVGSAQAILKQKLAARDDTIRAQGKSLEYWQQVFDNFDVDGNGFIDAKELTLVISDREGHQLSAEQLQDIVNGVDTDGDRRLNPAEFVQLMKMWKKTITKFNVEKPQSD